METYRYIMQYEPEVTRLVSEFLRPGMTMVDIGAHIGYYTLLAKIKVGEKGQVFAFEPDPKFFYALTQSLKLNKITIGVHLYQMAIADRNGFSSFFAHPSGSGSNLYASFPGSRSITVETITLDTFFEKVGWSKVDLIKIDVEGAELAVLRGMEELNRRNKSLRLIVEFAAKRRSGVQPEEFFNTLQRLGFTRVLAIEKPSLHKPEEIIREAARVGYLNLFCEKET
jgi:FkbM family methyltransferase